MKGRDPVVLKSFLLSKFIEIFRIERGSVVALYSLWSSVGGEDVFKYFLVGLEVGVWYILYHRVSGSLVNRDEVVVSIWLIGGSLV